MNFTALSEHDSEIKKINDQEEQRQRETITLIPSENYASLAVREACSSVLMNKYSEGYPNARYYPGNVHIDQLETLAQQRALDLFNLNQTEWKVNVQAHSGSPANLAIYKALLKKNDVALGMSLSHGGHLTHGHPVTASGSFFNFKQYGLSKKEQIDFNEVEKLIKQHKPKLIMCGATAYSRTIDFEKFSTLAQQANAYLVVDISHIAGLIVGGAHPSPFPYADVVMTTTHKTLRGPRAAIIFARNDLIGKINKAIIPGLQGGPHNHTIAAMAVALKECMEPEFKQYAKQIVKNAQALAQELQKNYRVVSNGTDNHLFVLDFSDKNFSGTEAEQKLAEVGILANRNTVPKDTKPFSPSGIRIGTPAVTTRQMGEKEMKEIAEYIHDTLIQRDPEVTRQAVQELALAFPPPM